MYAIEDATKTRWPGSKGSPPNTGVAGLASLDPPRKYYQWYYSGREANDDMWHAPQGLAAFLRAYYHVKSADWPDNHPHPLMAVSACAMASSVRTSVNGRSPS